MTLQQLVHAAGWTLLHSVWLFSAIAMLLGVAMRVVASGRCHVRYVLACATLLLMVAAVAGTFAWKMQSAPAVTQQKVETDFVRTVPPRMPVQAVDSSEVPDRAPPHPSITAATGEVRISQAESASWRSAIESWLTSWIAPIVAWWVGGVMLLSLRLGMNWLAVRRLRASGCAIKELAWTRAMTRIRNRLAVSQPVALMQSSAAAVPMVIGWLKPVVLVPMELVTSLTSAEIEAILAHELAHIRRHDYLVNLLQNVAETLLFYHPAVWWVSRQIRQEREFCCDDIAAGLCEGTVAYARALATVETLRSLPPALSVAATGGSLLDRIRRLAGREPQQAVGASGAMLAPLVLGCALVMLTSAAGPAADEVDPAELSDQEATAIARQAHRAAGQIDKLPRFYFEARLESGAIAAMEQEDDRSFLKLVEALDGVVNEDDFHRYQSTLAWDPERFVHKHYMPKSVKNDDRKRDGGADYFGTRDYGWAKEQWDGSRPSLFIRRASIGDFWNTLAITGPGYIGVTPRQFWWGNNYDSNQGNSPVPPDRVTYSHVGTETLGGEACHVLEAKGRSERLWIGRTSGLIRGAARLWCFGSLEPPFYETDVVKRIAGRSFGSEKEYAAWHREHHEQLSQTQQVELDQGFNELYFDKYAMPGNLTVFSDYREIAPGVWLPFKEERTICHPNENKFKYYRNLLTIDRVALDVDLQARSEDLAPKQGDKVQDQRFAAVIEYDYDPALTNDDFVTLVAAKQAELDEGKEVLEKLAEPMENMVGQPAPELSAEGWIGERPELAGKPYLIHFWATWCGPCKNDLPILKNVAKSLQVIGIHPTGTPVEEITKFIDDEKLSYPTLVAQKSDGDLVAGYPAKMYPYCVVVDADGKVAAHGRLGVELMEKFREAAEESKLAVPAGFRPMTVRTVDDAGKPVANTRIFVNVWPDEDNKYKTSKENYFTDAKGNARVLVPDPPRLFRVWTQKDGYVPLFAQWWPDEQKDGHLIPDEYTFTLPGGTKVGGTVMDDAGKPIEGATVEVMLVVDNANGDPAMRERPVPSIWLSEVPGPGENPCITTAQGRWSLNNVPAGDDVTVRVKLTHSDYISDAEWGGLQVEQEVTMEMLRNETATIAMHSGPRATGTVTDADGKPVADAVVIWGDDPYLQVGSQEVRTNAEGEYELPPLVPGVYPLTIVAESWRPELSFVEIEPEMESADFELQPGVRLRVKFVDENGEPIPEVGVGIREWRGKQSLYNHRHPNVLDTRIPVRAGKDGVYEWTWAPPDEVKYSFGKKGYEATELVLIADGEEFVVELSSE